MTIAELKEGISSLRQENPDEYGIGYNMAIDHSLEWIEMYGQYLDGVFMKLAEGISDIQEELRKKGD